MGPLEGLRIIEIAGIGPGPFCAMLLADMGADVVRVDRLDSGGNPLERPARSQVMHRNRRSIAADLKHPDAIAAIRKMCVSADALLEGFRPGVMERLGLGPEDCARANPRLVYGRMTGWGQDGPMASRAGHDINYVALSGVLGMLGRSGERPAPPLNVIGDMGGGGLLLAFGIVCALLEARRSGRGQVVDASMVEGSALLASTVYELRAAGWWDERRGSNLLDSGAPFYEVYETADGGFMAVGAIEPQFYASLLAGLGLDAAELPPQMDPAAWPQLKERFAGIFSTRTRAEWSEAFEGTDACVTPVLTLAEAALHPHNTERRTFLRPNGALQAAPAPRFSRSRPEMRLPPPEPGEHSEAVLDEFGFGPEEIAALRRAGAIA
ncbi:MAG: CoA transferase [Lysobacterales bacterium]|nr:MAG: CoA transferase [Xanthomonadales bacterium]